jgi:uncharacterized protein (TIGR02001 family)
MEAIMTTYWKRPGLAAVLALATALPCAAFAEEAAEVEAVAEAEATAEPAAAEAAKEEDKIPGKFSGNFSLVTDYSFRGVSQTGREIAIQGGIDWEHEIGLFLGLWGSSIKFPGDNTFLEQDFYGGYKGAIDDFSYQFLGTFFFYPKEQQFNYWEFALNLGYNLDFMQLSAGFLGSPDYFGTLGTGFYLSSGAAVPIPLEIPYVKFTVDGNIGWTTAEENILDDDEYFDWNIGLVAGLPHGLSLDFRYVDTDIKGVFDADARFVFGITYTM